MAKSSAKKPTMDILQLCPCGSGIVYGKCCETLHNGKSYATTAEALMRSRYSAYVANKTAYLLQTWHPSTRPQTIDPTTIANWCGLKIMRTRKGRVNDHKGTVEFKATAMDSGRISQLHEVSHFVKKDGYWLYVSGEIKDNSAHQNPAPEKVGRNDPCPCGSGKKFKKCCGP